MRTLAFDGRMGASGDMLLAALVAAGADSDALAPVTDVLPVAYEFDDVVEQGIAATSARVVSTEGADTGTDRDESSGDNESLGNGDSAPEDETAANGSADTDGGDHHNHGHSHDHDHDHSHAHAEGAGPERTYDDVLALVDEMALPESVRENAERAFELLGRAEAAVHDTELGATPFHEVGADDAIADVVGACLLLDDVDPDRVVTTPLSVGDGEATFSHGSYPVPVPAVTEIAARADWALRGGPVEAELLTPTGAAVLAAVAEGVDSLPTLRVETSGYGAGGYDFDTRPNVLRALVGETAASYGGDGDSHSHSHDHSHERRDSEGNERDSRHAADTSDSADTSDDAGRSDSADTSGDAGRSDSADTSGDAGGSDGAGLSEDTSGSDDAGTLRRDDIVVLETNLDDATPEVLGSLQTTLLDAGAYDVTVVPTTMKKARPGHLVKVICDPDDARRLARRLAAETGTLGVRATGASHRWIADRQFRTVTLEVDGDSVEVSVKLASDDAGTVYDVSAEYDDALRVARATGVPVRELLRRAEARARVETEDDGEAN